MSQLSTLERTMDSKVMLQRCSLSVVFEVTDVQHHHFKATGVQLQNLDCPVSSVVDQWQSWHEARKRGAIGDSNGWREIYRSSLAMSFFSGNTVVGNPGIWDMTRAAEQIQIDASSSRHACWMQSESVCWAIYSNLFHQQDR